MLGGADHPSLERRLGPWDAAAIVISNVIGVGIFITPSFIAQLLPNRAAILGVWALGGVLALFGALAYAELAARQPEAGGEYVYLREAFGGLAAFLTGWTSFVAGFSGAIAAGGVGVAAYLDRLIPGVGNATPLAAWHVGPLGLTISVRALVAIIVIMALALIQMRGVGLGRVLQNSLTTLKVGALLAFAAIGLLVTRVSGQPAFTNGAPVHASSWLLALVPIMFSYSGWNAAVYVAEEIKHPVRNVPRALLIGTVGTVALYLALNALYLRVVPQEQFLSGVAVGEIAAERLFGPAAAVLFAVVAVVILLSSLSAMTTAGPRVYFAMARDGAFVPAAARVHPRFRTPAIAIIAQAAWSSLLVLSGTFEQLLTYTGFGVILFSALAVLSLFFVRRTPTQAEVFKAWGYPWAPALFCLVGFAIVVNTFVDPQGRNVALAGVGVMAAGIPIYWWVKKATASPAPRGT
ncbi:MAG TPA: amino acid permease [Vicinamibacterales bacterium]|nr:amino acid permease [Vicinamibacterales bacterium]